MIITNPPKKRTFGHCYTQPDWPNLTLPLIANYFSDPQIIDNSHRLTYPDMKGDIAISIRSEVEYPTGLEMVKKFGIRYAGGQGATYHKKELEDLGTKVLNLDIPLEDSPFPRWDLVPKIPSKFFKGRNVGSIEMSRGCPHKCDFCAATAYWDTFEQKPNERIVEELKYLKSQDRTHIYLTDDNFGANKTKHLDLMGKIKDMDMKFFTQIRADTIVKNPDLIEKCADAGFYGFLIGFDTYDEDIMVGENKKSSMNTNILASEICRKNNIAIYGCHIYGLPSQKNPYDFEKTFELGRLNSDLFVMSFFNPLPGTKAADKAVKRGDDWKKAYGEYYKRHQFNLNEMMGAIAHNNPIVRKLKQGGYAKYLAYKFR